jgi:hypothetical protein
MTWRATTDRPTSNPCLLSQVAPYDVAINIRQALPCGMHKRSLSAAADLHLHATRAERMLGGARGRNLSPWDYCAAELGLQVGEREVEPGRTPVMPQSTYNSRAEGDYRYEWALYSKFRGRCAPSMVPASQTLCGGAILGGFGRLQRRCAPPMCHFPFSRGGAELRLQGLLI